MVIALPPFAQLLRQPLRKRPKAAVSDLAVGLKRRITLSAARVALGALLSALSGASALATTLARADQLPVVGQGRYTFWGWTIYHAQLRAAPGFVPTQWAQSVLRLRLQYERRLSAADIAQRSLEEMARSGALSPAQSSAWRKHLDACLRDVAPGDALSADFDGDHVLRFAFNQTATCRIEDATFARRFLGIWLSPNTSAPALRQSLLGLATDDR